MISLSKRARRIPMGIIIILFLQRRKSQQTNMVIWLMMTRRRKLLVSLFQKMAKRRTSQSEIKLITWKLQAMEPRETWDWAMKRRPKVTRIVALLDQTISKATSWTHQGQKLNLLNLQTEIAAPTKTGTKTDQLKKFLRKALQLWLATQQGI